MTTRKLLASSAFVFLFSGYAIADSMTQTFESRVQVVQPQQTGTVGTATASSGLQVTGPDGSTYIVDAAPNVVEEIRRTIQSQPDAVVRFHGQFNESPTRSVKVTRWERSTATTGTTGTTGLNPAPGSSVTRTESHKTETRTGH